MIDTIYFSHNTGASSDPKIQNLIGEFGAAGYGIFWRLVEMLHVSTNHKLEYKKSYILDGISKQMRLSKEETKAIIDYAVNDCELFKIDDTYLWSERVIRNIEDMQAKREKKSLAGKASAEKRAALKKQLIEQQKNTKKKQRSTHVKQSSTPLQHNSTQPNIEINKINKEIKNTLVNNTLSNSSYTTVPTKEKKEVVGINGKQIIFPIKFQLKNIFEKSFEQYANDTGYDKNGKVSEETFALWKDFHVFAVENNFEDIFEAKPLPPQDFHSLVTKKNFKREYWQSVCEKLLSSGLKPEHNLLFRIPEFMKFINGSNKQQTSAKSLQKVPDSATYEQQESW